MSNLSQPVEAYDEEDLVDLVEEMKTWRKKLCRKAKFLPAAEPSKLEEETFKLSAKKEKKLKKLGVTVLEKKVKILSKLHTRVKRARNAKIGAKKKALTPKKRDALTPAEKRNMTRFQGNIGFFCGVLNIEDKWSDSRDYKLVKMAHADLKKRSERTVNLRNLKAKWGTVFTARDPFPDESDYPVTGKEIEAFYQDLTQKFKAKKAEIAENKTWNKTIRNRALRLIAKAPTQSSKKALHDFADERNGEPSLISDAGLWELERSGEKYGLKRRKEYQSLRLDCVVVKRDNLISLLANCGMGKVEQMETLGVVRTSYGKIVQSADGFMPKFAAPKKKGKKRKKAESEEEEEEALQVCLLVVFGLNFCVFFMSIF